MQPILLDLFCGVGGSAQGYMNSGFYVVGIDINPQPNYIGNAFIQYDAFHYLYEYGHLYDMIHASPMCKYYSPITNCAGTIYRYTDQITPLRTILEDIGKPYTIENVMAAKRYMYNPVKLCGTMFGLNVIRHRLFECSDFTISNIPACAHTKKVALHGRRPNRESEYAAISGNFVDLEFGKMSMGVTWFVTRKELSQAIPPAYTEFIGKQAIQQI